MSTTFQRLVDVGECLLEAQNFERSCGELYRNNPTSRRCDAWLGSRQVVLELTEAYRYTTEMLREEYPVNTPARVSMGPRFGLAGR